MSTLITTTAQIGTIKDAGGNATAMTIDSSGRVFRPVLPAWRLALNANQDFTATQGVLTFNNSSSNGCFIQGGCTLSSGVITVPVAGVYQINASVRFQSTNSTYLEVYIRVGASDTHRSYHISQPGNPSTYHSISHSHVFKLAANDAVDIFVHAQGDTSWHVAASDLTHFSGVMIG